LFSPRYLTCPQILNLPLFEPSKSFSLAATTDAGPALRIERQNGSRDTLPARNLGKGVSRKASLPFGCHPERSFSEIEPTVIGLVGFFLPAIYFRGKTDGRLVIKRLRWQQMDCSSGWSNIDIRAEYRRAGVYRWRLPAGDSNAESY
jgi:hypothetical protein